MARGLFTAVVSLVMCFPSGSDGKESACNAGDQGLIPGLGRSPGEEHGNPLQYPCLENHFMLLFYVFIYGYAGSSLPHRLFSSCGYSLVPVQGLLTAGASLAAEHRLEGTQASAAAAPRLWSTGSIAVAHGLSCSVACGVFPDEGSNLCLLYWHVDSQPLSHQLLLSHFSRVQLCATP